MEQAKNNRLEERCKCGSRLIVWWFAEIGRYVSELRFYFQRERMPDARCYYCNNPI